MKSLVLHIGTHKTGSTAIQKFLWQNQKDLLRRGVLYPDAGRPEVTSEARYGHHRLAWAIRGRRGIEGRDDWLRLVDEIEHSTSHTAIVSSEVFAPSNESEIEEIRSLLTGHNVRVIVYLRSPVEFMRSSYKQLVKTGKYSKSFTAFISDHRYACDYGDIMRRWSMHFGRECVQPMIFERHSRPNGRLQRSFLTAVGIDDDQVMANGGGRSNVSPPDSRVSAIRWLNVVESKMPDALDPVIHRLRRHVLRGTTVGKAFVSLTAPISPRQICGPDERDLLRSVIGESHEAFLQAYISPEDQPLLQL